MKELLCPAGNFEKMKAAILYGANAVYLASDMFGMRAQADNFTLDELEEAVNYAHSHGVKLYVTVNTMPHTNEYERLKKYLVRFNEIGVDALIISDIGVFTLARELIPNMEIHISTQASVVSAAAAEAWHRMGAKRVVLARELSLCEINEIRKNTPKALELECFIHGSMCVSYSGRCLLSGHMIERDANRGMCAQPCRWNFRISGYEITEEKRPDLKMPIEEVNGETFIMSSKDTCTIEHIPELIEAGINSFKIEGRMKSAYYTALVTNTYKMAVDAYFSGKYEYNPLWLRELESVSHREYAPGYYFKNPNTDANVTGNPGYLNDKAYLAVVTEVKDGKVKLGQRNKMSLGDAVEIVTPGKVGRSFSVSALYNEAYEPIESTPHPYMEFFMEIPYEAHVGDIIRMGQV